MSLPIDHGIELSGSDPHDAVDLEDEFDPDGDLHDPELVSEFARRKEGEEAAAVPMFAIRIDKTGVKMSWGSMVLFIIIVVALSCTAYSHADVVYSRLNYNSSTTAAPSSSSSSSSSPSSSSSSSSHLHPRGSTTTETATEHPAIAKNAPYVSAEAHTPPVQASDSSSSSGSENKITPEAALDQALGNVDPSLLTTSTTSSTFTVAAPGHPLHMPCPTCEQVCGNVNPFAAAMKTGQTGSIVYSPTQIGPDSKVLTSESASFQGELNRLFSERPTPFRRWEDPDAYKATRKFQGRWNDRDEKMFAVTAEPIKYDTDEKKNLMKFDPDHFRQLNIPILWGDTNEMNIVKNLAHVHWNAAAEKRFVELMRKQQFPHPPVDCTKQKYLILDQWGAGFFSRYNVGMEFLLRGSNVLDRMLIIGFGPMGIGGSDIQASAYDDFAGQGMTQYFAPSSQCSDHPYVMKILQLGRSGGAGYGEMSRLHKIPMLRDMAQIQPGGNLFGEQFVHMCDNWCSNHPSKGDNSPLRRMIFDPRMDPVNYAAEAYNNMADHAMEHIYPCDSQECRAAPVNVQTFQASIAARTALWFEFFVQMASSFFFQLSPRIHVMRNLIADFWASQMLRKQNIYPTNENMAVEYYAAGEREYAKHEEAGSLANLDPAVNLHPLSNSAAIFVRRGDKCPDDAYCIRTGHFRGIGLFLYGVYQEELRRGKQFDSIFVMTDDGPALDALLVDLSGEDEPISDPTVVFKITPRSTKEELEAAMKTRDDLTIARAILKGRWVTHNPLSPATCFNPANRQGFEGFMVSLSYMLEYASFFVGHESSNVYRFVGRVVYAMNQLDPKIKRTGVGAMVINVADDFN